MTHKITELKGKDMLRKLLRLRVVATMAVCVVVSAVSPAFAEQVVINSKLLEKHGDFKIEKYAGRMEEDKAEAKLYEMFPMGTDKTSIDQYLTQSQGMFIGTTKVFIPRQEHVGKNSLYYKNPHVEVGKKLLAVQYRKKRKVFECFIHAAVKCDDLTINTIYTYDPEPKLVNFHAPL